MKTLAHHSICVVLVRSLYSRNVGSVSRAMANMGADRLILIDPKCELNLEARQGAAGAQTHLMESTTYTSWTEFFQSEHEGLRIAFCARTKKDTDALGYSERLRSLMDQKSLIGGQPLYLIFGPEDHGLENEDLEYANFICELPIYGSFKSLNLSHAVLLALFLTRSTILSPSDVSSFPSDMDTPTKTNPIEKEFYQFPKEAIQAWLSKLGFEFGERRTDVYKVIKRILLRNIASAKELRILEAVIHQTVRKLPEKK